MAKPALILVGADKGGVGKTTVARTLLDYFTAHQLATRAFDTETPKSSTPPRWPIRCGSSTRCRPQTPVSRWSMFAPGLMSPTLHALRDIGFLEAVKKAQITFVVFHILGSSIASLNEIEETAPFTSDTEYFLVKNFINNTNFFEWDQATHASYFKKLKDAVVINIPKLNEMAYEQVELASVPFLTFVSNKGVKGETANYSFVLRGYVRHWLGNVWAEYDRVKLLDLFDTTVETTAAPAPARVQAGSRA
jgi:hypothetical protein